ncbi:MAG: hypothetical protein QM644_20885 [Mobilitalea sp.]
MRKKFLILLTALIFVLVLTSCSSAKKSYEPVIENNSNVSDTNGTDESLINNKPSDTLLDKPSPTPTGNPVVTPNVPDIKNDTPELDSEKETTNNSTTNTENKNEGKKEDNQDKTSTKDDKKQPTPTPKLKPDEKKETNPTKNDNKLEPTKVPTPTYMPISIDSELSVNSPLADTSLTHTYKESYLKVYKYTEDIAGVTWDFTKSYEREFNLYTNFFTGTTDDLVNGTKYIGAMRRSYLDNNKTFKEELLGYKQKFYSPYEDEDGNIYAEIGKTSLYSKISNDKLFIVKMNTKGNIISRICVGDYDEDDLVYQNYILVKKNTLALFFDKYENKTWKHSEIKFINIDDNVINKVITFETEVSYLTPKSDGNYYIITADSFHEVFVYDVNTYELVNTIDTTKCKELTTYELNYHMTGQPYDSYTYDTDIRDGKVYFLRHSGIYVTDCLKSEFYQLLDGSKYEAFSNMINQFTSFLVGSNGDFYLMSIYYNAESPVDFWHYTR